MRSYFTDWGAFYWVKGDCYVFSGFRILDPVVKEVFFVPVGFLFHVKLRGQQAFLALFDDDVNMRRSPRIWNWADGAKIVLALSIGEETSEALEIGVLIGFVGAA